MPVLIAIAAAAAAVLWWMYRARTAAGVASELAYAATDVLNAARRFGFRRRANAHPVDGIERVDIATGALALAFVELDGLPSSEMKGALTQALVRQFALVGKDAEEILVLGHWLVGQCNGAQPAVERLAKRLYQIDGSNALQPVMQVLKEVALAGGGTLSPRQKDALEDIARHLRVR